MTKTKSTKRALLTSALALLMCVSMLIGSTFAWFTDSVTSNGNIIQAGNLNVEMYWAEGDEDTTTVTWNKVDGAIFNNEKWEPGYVEAKHVKITNEGNLAFKWRLRIVPNGTVEELADVIDVYYIEGATKLSREMLEGVAPVCTLRDLINDVDGAAHGALLPAGETETNDYERVGEVTATLAFKMRESAGNEYQGKKIGTDFSLQLMATQYTFEEDSFNNQYDVNAEADYWDGTTDEDWYDENETELVIITAEEFAAFAAQVNSGNTFAGKTVKLGMDIDLINKQWTPIGNWGTTVFSGTFDGQGHIISNLAMTRTNKSGVERLGLFGNIKNATIKNLTIDNAIISADANTARGAVLVMCADGTANTISNVTVSNSSVTMKSVAQAYACGVVAWANNNPGTSMIMNDITVSGLTLTVNQPTGSAPYVAPVLGYHAQADGKTSTLVGFTVEDVTINTTSSYAYIGGVLGFISKGNMTVSDGTVCNVKITSTGLTQSTIGGLIGYTYKVDPLKVENVDITGLDIDCEFTRSSGESYVGGVTGADESISRDNGGYKNVTVSGTIDDKNGAQTSVGGFVGISYQYPHTYTDCTADVDVVSNSYRAGGFAGTISPNGWASQTEAYYNCTAKGDVKGAYAGGFVGCAWLNASANTTLLMSGVKAEGTVTATIQGGGLIGSAWGSGNACSNIIIKDSVAAKTVTGSQVGGVVGAHSMGSGKTITLENVTSYITPEIR